MITEKIQNMVKDLAMECQKNDVAMSLGAFDESGNVAVGQVGSKNQVETVIDIQLDAWFDSMENCGCSGCRNKLKELQDGDESVAKSSKVHSFVVNDAEEFLDVIDRIKRGEFQ